MGLKRKAAFLTLGCKVNQYETDAMMELLKDAGYEIVDFKDKADVYVINTCSVTNIADRKSRQMIHRARRKNPDAVVAAAGCYIQTGGQHMLEEGQADILIGNNRKKDIVLILEDYFLRRGEDGEENSEDRPGRGSACAYVHDISGDREYEALSLHDVSGHTRVYLKIQDGCNQFCSYCIIPYARGRIRSRDPREVVEEVKRLTDRGFREVVLTGIHLSSYGLDLTEKREEGHRQERQGEALAAKEVNKDNPYLQGSVTLLTLIRDLQKIPGLARIRLSSLEPRIITETFVKGLKECSKVCPHFHLSLQSGCDATLRRMNRRYSTAEYRSAVELLRSYYDSPAITTDVIAGFVGETEEEFEQTRNFLEEIGFYEMHVFKYSVREGTRAQRMEGHLPDHVKTSRSAILLEMAKRHKKAYEQTMTGRRVQVLLEEEVTVAGQSYWQGYTDRYVKVFVENHGQKHELLQNKLVNVEIIGFLYEKKLEKGLFGKVSIEF